MKIFFETDEPPINRKAILFADLPDYDDYPSAQFEDAVEALAAGMGMFVTESCDEREQDDDGA